MGGMETASSSCQVLDSEEEEEEEEEEQQQHQVVGWMDGQIKMSLPNTPCGC